MKAKARIGLEPRRTVGVENPSVFAYPWRSEPIFTAALFCALGSAWA